MTGDIKWYSSQREYGIQVGRARTRIPAHQVSRVSVPRPRVLNKAEKLIKAGRHSEAVRDLRNVLKDYKGLIWDAEAAGLLSEAYLAQNRYKDAIEMCEEVMRSSPGSVRSMRLARTYWTALEKDGQTAKLNNVLGDAVKNGSREVAAVAQIKRADLDRGKGKLKEALREGYLRTVILYRDVREIQPEALYKASECFRQLGQQSYAEKMRTRLLQVYPKSEEARKVRAGT